MLSRAILTAWGLALAVAPAAAHEHDARAWLERMAQATQTLNYDGTFVYRKGDHIESMRIIHRVEGGQERERLVSLSGSPREVLRDSAKVTCILPDDGTVVVGKARAARPFAGPSVALVPDLERFYALSLKRGHRVADRPTRLVVVEPRDEYRYGYRLWIDRETGLLLRSELVVGQGAPIEQIVYTSISLPESIPDELLEPGIAGDGFRRLTSTAREGAAPALTEREWGVGWLPDGFVLQDHAFDPIARSRVPVEHLVYSDGLSSLSVFIEPASDGAKRLQGLSSMGAVNAYGRLVDGYHVTVVGEVPAQTAARVGQSVARR